MLVIHNRSKVKTRQSQSYKLKKIAKNSMKWIQPELKVLQSGHGMRDGRTDTEWNQYIPQQLFCAGGIMITQITRIQHYNHNKKNKAQLKCQHIVWNILYIFINSLAPGKFEWNFRHLTFQIQFQWLMAELSLVILPLDQCHSTLLMISQHWFR